MVKTGRRIFFSAITGILLGFCYGAGKTLDIYDSLDLKDKKFYAVWLALSVLFGLLVFLLWGQLRRRCSANETKRDVSKRGCLWKDRIKAFEIPYGVSVIFLLLCWLPALLSLFPGAFSYDAYSEWQQIHTGQITSHHPVIHVLLVGGLAELGQVLFGSYNVGIFIYTLLQMVIVAFVLASTLSFLKELKVPGIGRLLALLFYGLSPVMQLYAITATKDVLFTAAELMFYIYVIRFCRDREALLQSRKQMCFFCVTAFCTMILRNNGLYIVLAMLILLGFAGRKDWKKHGKKPGLMLVGILLPYLLYTGPFYSMLHVASGGVEEMLSVPLQQMARVHRYEADALDREDLELLYKIVPKENLDEYRATVSDFVKRGFNREAFGENKEAFFKLWLKWGTEHPLTYINSFLVNTVDMWYPNAVIDGYRHGDGRGSYFDYQVDKPGEEQVFLQGAHEYYESISHDMEIQQKPFVFLALSPGWYFVMFLVLFFYLWCEKRKAYILPCMIFVFHFGTVLLGPMALVRYMLIFYYGLPVLLACVAGREGEDIREMMRVEASEKV